MEEKEKEKRKRRRRKRRQKREGSKRGEGRRERGSCICHSEGVLSMYFVLVVFRVESPYWLKEACVHIGDSLSLSKTIHRTVWFMKIFHLPLTCFWELQFDGVQWGIGGQSPDWVELGRPMPTPTV